MSQCQEIQETDWLVPASAVYANWACWINTWIIHLHPQTLDWHHNGHDSVSNHQPHDCLLHCLFRRRSEKILKLRVTGPCAGNSPETGEFPAQMASNAENVSIWWCHHEYLQISNQWKCNLLRKTWDWSSKINSDVNMLFYNCLQVSQQQQALVPV